MQLWLRKVRVTFSGETSGGIIVNPGGIEGHQLKVGFSISKGISGSSNTGSIELTNLAESTRNAVGKELDNVLLEVGYLPPTGGGRTGVIFKGQMRDVEHTREGTDIVTRLSAGEGDRAFRNAVISKTYEKGTEVSEVVEGLYEQFEKEGIDRGEWVFPEDLEPYQRPVSVYGGAAREMNTLGRSHGFYWSIQNGTMELFPGDGHLPGVVVLNEKTGLIDVPTVTDNGVRAKALLNPEIRPGRTVKIESQVLEMNGEDSLFRVSEVNYQGDNRDGNFVVQITGESIEGGKVNEGKRA